PVRARVRGEGRLGKSDVRWTLSLLAGDPRVFFDLKIDFRDKLSLLQMPVHLAGPPTTWTSGLAGGTITRQLSAIEWPALGWSKVGDAQGDIALVTQDSYSLSLQKNCWQWTLLRSPKMAWGGTDPFVYTGRNDHTDQGEQSFRF